MDLPTPNDELAGDPLSLQKTVEDTPSEGESPEDSAQDSPQDAGTISFAPTRAMEEAQERVTKKKKIKPWDKWKSTAEDQQDWWFASTAIPLLAATIAPLANVFSIAALVSNWRTDLTAPPGTASNLLGPSGLLLPYAGNDIQDPPWVYGTNLTSLICGYLGNLFLFLNFTNRIPYIFALPVTIILWFVSTAILTAIQVSMNIYAPPTEYEAYTQAFWYGVIASVLYLICAMGLMGNMVGYFLGHYPQHFNLTNAQRTLILQTFLFFIWMAGGAGVFSKVQDVYGMPGDQWNFAQALYFCDVTILTIGFGDYTPDNDVGRGFILPFAVGGIIMLGLMISSITTFAAEMTATNVFQKRVDRERSRTLQRSMETSTESASLAGVVRPHNLEDLQISSPMQIEAQARGALHSDEPGGTQFLKRTGTAGLERITSLARTTTANILHAATPGHSHHHTRRHSLLVLREEKDRFDAMRKIQHHSENFKRWSSLIGSMVILLLLWLIGAVAFWRIEMSLQGWTYFDGLYFCYISLLTIGYGDFTPKTNAGRPFFVVWSLLAVPSITILISDLANTVVSAFRDWTNALGDFTLLAKHGIWQDFLERHPWLLGKLESRAERKERERRIAEGFELGPDPDEPYDNEESTRKVKTLEQLAMRGKDLSEHQMAKKLANAMKDVAAHVKDEKPRKYEYEEWVEFTELVRFTRGRDEEKQEEEEEGLIEWDWIGEDGPIMSSSEPEWLLERLCESMNRYVRKQARVEDRREKQAERKSKEEKRSRQRWRPEAETHHELEDEDRLHSPVAGPRDAVETKDYVIDGKEEGRFAKEENEDSSRNEKDYFRQGEMSEEDAGESKPPKSPEEMSQELDERLASTGLFG